ncbi:uncharacterized protein EI90DRAFT_3065059 [Cantharellus anzutake]|uniref:uncharacterized protein n=1 Tax=Cantharellus anzutake TaxID=1750568 RepID=UPI001902C820|nr:uncharacterized protein EI90DRAFT_3065059 [Cantharellus anzutake]KAF8328392.1 hypothetical protein EI90DRAFT_3065059 [Cantharellus anzutake]
MKPSAIPVKRPFPVDILEAIAAAVFDAALPCPSSPLDPLYLPNTANMPTSSPSAFPAPHWSEPVARKTLANMCLVSKDFYYAAKPWLWRRIEVNLPRNWLRLLDEICGEDEEHTPPQVIPTILMPVSTDGYPHLVVTSPPSSLSTPVPDNNVAMLSTKRVTQLANVITMPDKDMRKRTVPLDLLSPGVSRDPSPRRLRARSPGRWRFIRDVNRRIHAEPGLYVPTPVYSRPGRYVRHLDFNHFRTISMRHFVGDGTRFVTEARLERLLKEMPNLRVFGATELIESAVSANVLAELILRGLPYNGAPVRGRGAVRLKHEMEEADDEERRAEYKPLEALDFCGCASPIFATSLQQFVKETGLGLSYKPAQPKRLASGHFNGHAKEPSLIPVPLRTFPGLRRLCLDGVASVSPDILSAFVCSFPSLTHLDLASTCCTPTLLQALAATPTIRLHSLSLSRCSRLTSESITDFLIDGGAVTEGIRELSLYGDATAPCPLTRWDLGRIVTEAKCFIRGQLEYLDLSGSALDKSHLAGFSPQPSLRSLGLNFLGANISMHEGTEGRTEGLTLGDIRDFLFNKAPNVEIVTLVGSTPELTGTIHDGSPHASPAKLTASKGAISIALHSQLLLPLCVPACISSDSPNYSPPEPPTRLRVVELSAFTLSCLGTGAFGWKIVKSRGGRAWYVDSTAVWADGALRRGVQEGKGKEVRVCLERWACEGSPHGVGWHARKMEVLHGQGMFGREDGLYGAVSFAYAG